MIKIKNINNALIDYPFSVGSSLIMKSVKYNVICDVRFNTEDCVYNDEIVVVFLFNYMKQICYN